MDGVLSVSISRGTLREPFFLVVVLVLGGVGGGRLAIFAGVDGGGGGSRVLAFFKDPTFGAFGGFPLNALSNILFHCATVRCFRYWTRWLIFRRIGSPRTPYMLILSGLSKSLAKP